MAKGHRRMRLVMAYWQHGGQAGFKDAWFLGGRGGCSADVIMLEHTPLSLPLSPLVCCAHVRRVSFRGGLLSASEGNCGGSVVVYCRRLPRCDFSR